MRQLTGQELALVVRLAPVIGRKYILSVWYLQCPDPKCQKLHYRTQLTLSHN